jgi:hypothetical protein
VTKIRLRIASILDRLPGQCWADLVQWSLRLGDRRSPWSPIGWSCRADAARCGTCYCGKLRAPQNTESTQRRTQERAA